MMSFFESMGPYEAIDLLTKITPEDIAARLETHLNPDRMAISIVYPA